MPVLLLKSALTLGVSQKRSRTNSLLPPGTQHPLYTAGDRMRSLACFYASSKTGTFETVLEYVTPRSL